MAVGMDVTIAGTNTSCIVGVVVDGIVSGIVGGIVGGVACTWNMMLCMLGVNIRRNKVVLACLCFQSTSIGGGPVCRGSGGRGQW